MSQIMEAIEQAKADQEHPSMIILNTKKGKGCFFAEDVFNHNIPVTKEQADQAIAELEQYRAELGCGTADKEV